MIKSFMVFQVHIFMNPGHIPLGQQKANRITDQLGSFSLPLSLFLLLYFSPWLS